MPFYLNAPSESKPDRRDLPYAFSPVAGFANPPEQRGRGMLPKQQHPTIYREQVKMAEDTRPSNGEKRIQRRRKASTQQSLSQVPLFRRQSTSSPLKNPLFRLAARS